MDTDRGDRHKVFIARLDQLFNQGYYDVILNLVSTYLAENWVIPELVILKGMAEFALERYENALQTFADVPFTGTHEELVDYFVVKCYINKGDSNHAQQKREAFERNYPDSSYKF